MAEDAVEVMARALFAHQQFDADMVFDDFKDEYVGEARAALAALEGAGYAVVPVEPTEAMWDAGLATMTRDTNKYFGGTYSLTVQGMASGVWFGMLAAYKHPAADTAGPTRPSQ